MKEFSAKKIFSNKKKKNILHKIKEKYTDVEKAIQIFSVALSSPLSFAARHQLKKLGSEHRLAGLTLAKDSLEAKEPSFSLAARFIYYTPSPENSFSEEELLILNRTAVCKALLEEKANPQKALKVFKKALPIGGDILQILLEDLLQPAQLSLENIIEFSKLEGVASTLSNDEKEKFAFFCLRKYPALALKNPLHMSNFTETCKTSRVPSYCGILFANPVAYSKSYSTPNNVTY